MGIDDLCNSLAFMAYDLADDALVNTCLCQQGYTGVPGIVGLMIHPEEHHDPIPVSIPEGVIRHRPVLCGADQGVAGLLQVIKFDVDHTHGADRVTVSVHRRVGDNTAV